EAELDVIGLAVLLARDLGVEIARAVIGHDRLVPLVEAGIAAGIGGAEQALAVPAEHLAAGLVIAVPAVALDAAAEHDVVEILDQGAEPALAFAGRILALFLMGDVGVDAQQAAVVGRDLLAANPALVDPAFE